MEVDLNVPPLELRWTKLLLRWEARVLRLPRSHPVRQRWLAIAFPVPLAGWRRDLGSSLVQRVTYCHQVCGIGFEQANLVEPLSLRLLAGPRLPLQCCPFTDVRAVRWVADYRRDAAAVAGHRTSVFAFSDGSAEDGGVGAGAFSIHAAAPLAALAGASRLAIPWAADSFIAELFAIHLCLLAFSNSLVMPVGVSFHLHLLCDSRAVLGVLSGSVQPACHIALLNSTLALAQRVLAAGHRISLVWIPGHVGIPGNVEVDASAKAALRRDATAVGRDVCRLMQCPFTSARRAIEVCMQRVWTVRWQRLPAGAHLRSILPVPGPAPHCWSADRHRDRLLVWLRHGTCLNQFMHRVRPLLHPDPLCPFVGCHSEETVEHFLLRCPGYAVPRARLLFDLQEWFPIGVLPPLSFLLGVGAPVAARPRVTGLVLRFLRDTGRSLLARA